MQLSAMRINAAPFRLSLQWGTPLTVTDGKGVCITARCGTVWITQDNDLRDVVLASGESFRLEHEHVAVLQAMDDAEVLIRPPRRKNEVPTPARSFAQRLWRALGRTARRTPALEAGARVAK